MLFRSGNAIILASRLSGEAVAGEILLAPRTYAAIDEAWAEPVGERQLKGFSRPMAVYAAVPRGEGAPDRVAERVAPVEGAE